MKDIQRLDRWARSNNFAVEDIYASSGVELYVELSHSYDLTTPISLAARCHGPVLELCCGAGRVGLPLIGMGVDYTGIDAAHDMLRRFEVSASEEGLTLEKGRLLQGDARHLDQLQGKQFDLVLIPAFSVVLFDAGSRIDMFSSIREVLSPDGHLALEVYRPTYYQDFYSDRESVTLWTPLEDGGSLTTVAEMSGGREELRFVEHRSQQPPVVFRTMKHIVTGDALVAELGQAGMVVSDRHRSVSEQAEWMVSSHA